MKYEHEHLFKSYASVHTSMRTVEFCEFVTFHWKIGTVKGGPDKGTLVAIERCWGRWKTYHLVSNGVRSDAILGNNDVVLLLTELTIGTLNTIKCFVRENDWVVADLNPDKDNFDSKRRTTHD